MNIHITGIGRISLASAAQGIEREQITDKSFRNFDRLDLYSKMGLAALSMALKDAGRYNWTEKRDMGMTVFTTYGCLETDAAYYETVLTDDDDGAGPSPNLFAYTLPNCFLGEASILFGLTGPAFVVNENNPSGLECLHTALDALSAGETRGMLCGRCDAPAPRAFSRIPLAITGASFILMESTDLLKSGPLKSDPLKSYGLIKRDQTGGIRVNDRSVNRWPDLFTNMTTDPAENPAA